jgi:hypothetical protein
LVGQLLNAARLFFVRGISSNIVTDGALSATSAKQNTKEWPGAVGGRVLLRKCGIRRCSDHYLQPGLIAGRFVDSPT